MPNYDHLNFFRELLLNNNKLYAWEFDEEDSLIYSNCPFETIMKNLLFGDMNQNIREVYDHNSKPFYYTSPISLTWFFVPFESDGHRLLHVLGPVFLQEISERLFKQQMDINKMSISSKAQLSRLIHDIPVISRFHFLNFGTMLYYTLFRETCSVAEVESIYPQNLAIKKDIPISAHGTHEYEKMLYGLVKTGNLQYREVLASYNSQAMANQEIGLLCPGDPLRQSKDEMIVHTTLTTRAAMAGGMNTDEAYSLSDYYIQQFELSDNEKDLINLSVLMLDTFIRRVHDTSEQKSYSREIEQTLSYIQLHVTEKLELKDIAYELGYTPYYLSSKFKKEVGTTIGAYITERKISYAKHLLAASKLPIAEISDMLNFSTPSAFAAAFKKHTGVTPRHYRQEPQI